MQCSVAMQSIDPRIAPLIERTYEVFPAQKLNGLGVCNCGMCMEDHEQAEVAAKDRREILETDLAIWNSAVPADSGLVPQNVARHLAPCLLKVLATGSELAWLEETTLNKTGFGDRNRWTGEEAELLDAFRDSYLDLFRGDERQSELLDDALCTLANGRYDLHPALSHLETWPVEDLILRLWKDWVSWTRQPSVWRCSFWDPTGENEAEYLLPAKELTSEWYRGPHVRNALEHVFNSHEEASEIWQKASYVEIALASFKGDK